MARILKHADRDDLARSLAGDITAALAKAIADTGNAMLAVSGGTTPARLFAELSGQDIDWSRVVVALVDERCVPESSERSNARLVRQTLLTSKAAAARFIPLFDPADADPAGGAAARLAGLAPTVAVLGMGNDGHTASLFPGGDRLAEALAADGPATILPMDAEGAGETRLTMTAAYLKRAAMLALHIEGDDKIATLDKAMAGNDIAAMPIRTFLHDPALDLVVHWAPKT